MSALRKLLFLLVLVPVAVVLIAFGVANRHPVTLVLDPLAPQTPALSLEVPLFALLFAALLLGVVLGGVAAWLGQGKWRRTARRRAQEASHWQREAERLNRQLEAEQRPRLPRAVNQ